MTPASRPTAVIAEDETTLAVDLQDRLQRLWPQLEVLALCADGVSALDCIARSRPQIAFLDVRMPGLSGMEVAARLAHDCLLVFVTAYDKHAVKAYEHAAVDYLLKPVDDDRLADTVQRLQRRLGPATSLPLADETGGEVARETAHATPASAAARPLRWIRAGFGSEVRIVPVEAVRYFQALNKYTTVVTDSAEMLISTPLRELLPQLDPERFCQIHRGTIVNLEYARSVRRGDDGHLRLALAGSDLELPVSRSFAARFRQM